MVNESILRSTAQFLGIPAEHTHFDTELIQHINTALFALQQLGVGPKTGYRIVSDQEKWTDILGTRLDLDGVKSYIGLKVKLAFDPPQMGYFLDAVKGQITELEWRLLIQVEQGGV